MRNKLSLAPIKELLGRLTDKLALGRRLPHINLPPVRDWLTVRLQPLTVRFRAWTARLRPLIFRLRFLWPVPVVGALIVLAILAVRWWPASPAAAMPGEIARLNLGAGVQVILWHALDERAASALVELVDEFNAANPWKITVVPQNQGAYSRLRGRLEAAWARGAPPDLAALYPQHAAAYADEDRLAALDAYLDDPKFGLTSADRDDFIAGLLEGERNPQLDRLTSFPIGPNVMLLIYNLDWLRSIGYQGPPPTWGTFKDACSQAMADHDNNGVPDAFGYAFVADAPTFSALVLSREGQLLSPDGRRALFNTPAGEKALRTIRDNFDSGCAYTVPGRDWDRGDFVDARVLFNIAPSSALPAYREMIERTSPFRWGAAPLPHNTLNPITPLYGPSWIVPKTTPERQLAAWLFVRWFSESRQSQRWALATYTLPVRRSAVEALRKAQDLDPNLAQVLSLAPYGQPEPTVAGWEAVGKIVVQAMQQVAGGLEPQAALDQAEQKANAALSGGAP